MDRLILFTKVPRSGRVKTRLIPLLGEAGALQAHRELTRLTLTRAETFQQQTSIDVEVCFTGGSESELRNAFPGSYASSQQAGGDLGDRLASAFRSAFDQGASRVVIVGTDCPELGLSHLTEAFDRLQDHELVLGPANDGGYYLIGLSRYCQPLFEAMPWSQSSLWKATVAAAERAGLRQFHLEKLSDVDLPADWLRWNESRSSHELDPNFNDADCDDADCDDATSWQSRESVSPIRLSILIPVYRDHDALRQCLAQLECDAQCEVIVAVADADEESAQICNEHQVRFLSCEKGRARQLNLAADEARGEILLFLHADCRLPAGYLAEVKRILAESHVAGGAFRLAIASARGSCRRVARWANRRSTWLGLPYGDQAIFVRSSLFRQLGGFRDMPIMEDFDFVRRVSKRGKLVISPLSVVTSDRRWKEYGVWRVTILNQVIVGGYLCGVAPHRLAKWYRHGLSVIKLPTSQKLDSLS